MPEKTLKLPAWMGIYVGPMSEWAKRFPAFSPLKPEEWDELKWHLDGIKPLDDARLRALLTKIRDS